MFTMFFSYQDREEFLKDFEKDERCELSKESSFIHNINEFKALKQYCATKYAVDHSNWINRALNILNKMRLAKTAAKKSTHTKSTKPSTSKMP